SDRPRLGQVAGVAADALVAARAERERPLAGEDDDADRGVLAGTLERVRELDDGLRPERVAHLRPVDRDLRDAVAGELVADVLVLGRGLPVDCHTVEHYEWTSPPAFPVPPPRAPTTRRSTRSPTPSCSRAPAVRPPACATPACAAA